MTLLVNEEAARHFCRMCLLPYKRPRILQCVARKKYAGGEMNTRCLILERVILRFDKGQASEDAFIRELNKLDILANAGLYAEPSKDAMTEKVMKPEWMVPYITAFCLDEDDAADEFMTKVMKMRREQRKALGKSMPADEAPSMTDVVSKMRTLLHQHPCKEFRWLKLDVDTKDPTLLWQLQKSMKGTTIMFAAESRGGYHVVLEKGPCCQSLYKFARHANAGVPKENQWITIENNSSPMLVIPGTSQGGFVVQCATEIWQRAVE